MTFPPSRASCDLVCALAEAYGLQRFPPLDVVREGSLRQCDESPAILRIPDYRP
jgi:hypothetical protein